MAVMVVVVMVVVLAILRRLAFFLRRNTVMLAQTLAQFGGLRAFNLIVCHPKVETCEFRLLRTRKP
jgi:hypothetical protein